MGYIMNQETENKEIMEKLRLLVTKFNAFNTNLDAYHYLIRKSMCRE